MAYAYNSFALAPGSESTAIVSPAAEKVRRHPKYYLNGGDVHFLVENYIFRVHRYFFERESQFFREKLGAPPPPGQPPKGSSDVNPFPLDDVHEEDFSRFLWVFYNPKYSIYDANAEEWISILKLSSLWEFAEIKQMSCRYLEGFELDPIRKIELYQAFKIDKRLLIPAYTALVNRLEPLTLEEGRRLTLETALLIATARECARGKLQAGRHTPVSATVKPDAMIDIIKEVFILDDRTPNSPSLEPIAEGRGPSAFTATPMSPSRIVTAPLRDGAKSPTPMTTVNTQPLILTNADQPTVPIPPTPSKSNPSTTYPALLSSRPSESKALAPEVPTYLQTSFSQSSFGTGPNTPLKSAVSPNPANGFDPFATPAEPPASSNGSAKPEADKSKPGQSSVAQKPEQTTSKAVQATAKTGSKPAKAQPTPTAKTTRAQAPPPPPTVEPAAGSKTSSKAAKERTEKATTPTNPRAKATRGTAAPEDEGVTTEPASTGSSGYTTDVTSSADHAGVVGNEIHDVVTSTKTAGTKNQESKSQSKNGKGASSKAQGSAGDTAPGRVAKMASRSSTPRPKDMSRSSTPRPEVTITIPTVPSASSAAAEAVAGVLPQLLASSTASAGAAAPSGGAPLVAAPDPKVPTGDALKPEQQEALPAAVGQDKKAEGSGESTAEGANKPAAVEGAPALEAVDAPKEAGEKATDVVPASVPPAAEASPSEDAGGETKPEGQATEPAAPAATPSADPEAEKTVEVPPEKPVEQEVARAGAGEDTVKDAPKEAEPGTKTESISKAEEELSKDTVTAGEAPQPEAVSTDGKSSEPTTPTAHPTPAFTYNLGNFPKPPAPPSETYTSDAWDDYLDAHEHPEEHDLSGEPIIVTHEDAVGAGALTPTVEAEQKDAIGADAVLVQPEDAVKTPVTPQNDGADIQAASVVEGNTSSSLSEKKESTSTENLAENPSVTGDAATVPVAVDQPSSETKETEAKVETTPAAAPTSKEPETGTVPEAPATKTDESKPEPAVAEEASASKPGEAKEEAEQEAESTEPKTSEAASTASTAQPSVDDKTKVAESQSETAKDKALPEALAEIAAADADIGPAPITTPPPVAVTSPAAKPDDAQKPKSGTATTLTTDSPSSGPRSAVPPPTPSKAMNATASTFVPQSPSRRLDASAPSLPSPGGAPFASQQPVRMPPTPMEMPGSPASSRPSSVHSVEYKPSQRGARTPAGMSPRVEQPPTPKSSSSWWGGLVKKAQTFIDPVSEDEHNEHRGQAYGHARQPSGAQQHFGAQQQYGAQQHFGAQQQFGRPMAQTPPPPLHKPQAHDQLGPPRREAQRPASVPPSPAPAIPPAPATVADAPPPAAPATPATPSAALAPTAVTSPAPTEQKKVDAPASSPPDDKQPEKEEEQVQEVQAPPQEELAKPPHQPEKEQKESPVTQEAKADEQPSKPSLPPLDTSGGAGPAAEAQDDDDDNVPLATKVASSVPKRLQEGDDTEGTSEAEPASSRPTSPEVDKAQGGLTKNQKKNQRKKGKKGGK